MNNPLPPLNAICYMFWDVNPLLYLKAVRDESALVEACVAVLAATLAMDHPACQEAAIHGYGHFHSYYPHLVEAALDRFLETEIPDPRLRTYAEAARIGYIQ